MSKREKTWLLSKGDEGYSYIPLLCSLLWVYAGLTRSLFSSFHLFILPLFSVLYVIGEQPCLQITYLSFCYWVEITTACFLIMTSFVYLVISSNHHNSSRKKAFIETHKSGRWHTNHLNFFYAVLLFFVRILSCVWFEGIEIMANYLNGRAELKEQIHPKKKIHSLSSHPTLL